LEHRSEKKKKARARKKKAFLFGVGLDSQDEHLRITQGPNFRLVGGSQDTHEQMQETAIKVNEELSRRGKQLEQIGPGEFLEIVQKVR